VGKRAINFQDIHGTEECGILTDCSRKKKKKHGKEGDREIPTIRETSMSVKK
jgi:hypothetical protein